MKATSPRSRATSGQYPADHEAQLTSFHEASGAIDRILLLLEDPVIPVIPRG